MDSTLARQLARDRSLRELFGDRHPDGAGPLVRNAFPAYRVFLYGFEVTEDVTAITVQNHVGKQPNSCTITLLNELDKYLLTVEDMFYLINTDPRTAQIRGRHIGVGSTPDDPESQREAAYRATRRAGSPLANPDAGLDDDFRLSNPNSVKAEVYFLKSAHQKIPVDVFDEFGRIKQGSRVFRSRWPFFAGRSIWHGNDPLRVFVRDIFDPTKWYYAFSGLVTDIRDDVTKDNQKTQSITAEDATKLLRLARTVTNPGLLDQDLVLTAQDEAEVSAWTSQLTDMTLPQIMDRLVFGLHRDSDHLAELPTGWEDLSETDLKRVALQTGLVPVSFPGAKDSIAQLSPGDSLDSVIAVLTPEELAQLDAFVARRRADADSRGTTRSPTFEIEVLNRFGDRLLRRFGVSGVGAFKQARETAVAEIPNVSGTSGSFFATQLPPPLPNETRSAYEARIAASNQAYGGSAMTTAGIGMESQIRESIRRARESDSTATAGPFLFSLGEDPNSPTFTVPITLPEWDSVLSWEVRPIDLTDLLNKDVDAGEYRPKLLKRLRSTRITAEDVITVIGEDPLNYPVDGGRLLMLLPIGAGELGNEVVGAALAGGIPTRTAEFQNRLTLIYDVLERIEFLFYATPKGDLVAEFPLYDFDPADFGYRERVYIAEIEDTSSHEATLSDAAVKTEIQVEVALTNYTQDQATAQQVLRPVVVRNQALFPTYGVRSEKANMRGLIQSVPAAHVYGNMMLNRLNADAYSVNLPILPRFDICLNRPVLWKGRCQIGTTMSVVHNMQWNGQWRTTLGLSHARGWAGQTDEQGNLVFVHIGGATSRPLNYRVLFSRSGHEESRTPDINEKEEQARLSRRQEDLDGLRLSGPTTVTPREEIRNL